MKEEVVTGGAQRIVPERGPDYCRFRPCKGPMNLGVEETREREEPKVQGGEGLFAKGKPSIGIKFYAGGG